MLQSQLTEIVSKKRMLESCSINARRDDESKRRKCITGSWDIKLLPSDLMQEILYRLGLKANIRASLVCKTWFETAVSVRKLRPRPWLFYPEDEYRCPALTGGGFLDDAPPQTYILVDPTSWHTCRLTFPGLKNHKFTFSRDGWLLVSMDYYPRKLILLLNPFTQESMDYSRKLIFLLNPFTQERIYLPPITSDYCLAFSAAPTSSSCLVISVVQRGSILKILTWRPGETEWTIHCFENQSTNQPSTTQWTRCVVSNAMFYCLNTCGHLGVFDPSKTTWNILPLNPCPAFLQPALRRGQVMVDPLMVEHEGDIFVMSTRWGEEPCLYKPNFETMVWEEKRELGGLTVFASEPTSLTRSGLSDEDMNRIYPSQKGWARVYYNYGAEKKISNRLPTGNPLSNRIAWVDPPHNL